MERRIALTNPAPPFPLNFLANSTDSFTAAEVGVLVKKEDLIESEAEDIDNIGFNFFKGNFRKLLDGPVEPASPTEDTIGQFCEKGSIKRRQVSIALKGVG